MKFSKHLNYLYVLLLIPIIIGIVICLKRENKLLNFINKPTPTPTANAYQIKCNRNEPPKIDPKMQEAIKLWENTLKGFGDDITSSHHDCINVEYKDLGNNNSTRGEFDPGKDGKIENVKIFVDISFQNNPILTSLILTHEFTHLEQSINDARIGKESDCIMSEVEAVHNQISYILKLRDTDFKLASQQVEKMKDSKNIRENAFAHEWINSLSLLDSCTNDCYKTSYKEGQTVFQKCIWDYVDLSLKKGIESSPSYRESCKESLI